LIIPALVTAYWIYAFNLKVTAA